MSNPNIAGAMALLFEACPSLGISPLAEDYSGDREAWFSSHDYRFVHEAEVILEASAEKVPYEEGREAQTRIYTDDRSTGWGGRPIDYVQGYGFVDLERAVGIALALQRLREDYPGRHVTVFDAIEGSEGVVTTGMDVDSNALVSAWRGEYSRFNDQNGKPLVVQNQTKRVFVPEGAVSFELELQYVPFSLTDLYAGGISVEVDYDLDGAPDWGGDSPLFSRPGGYDVPIQGTSRYYGITVRGQGIRLLRPLKDTSYVELRIPYGIRALVIVETANVTAGREAYSWAMNADPHHDPARTSPGVGRLYATRYLLDEVRAPWEDPGRDGDGGVGFPWIVPVMLVLAAIASGLYLYLRKRR